MKLIKEVRRIYGFKQHQLADFLSVSKGLLAMAETGRRELPTAALLKLNRLYQNALALPEKDAGKNYEAQLEAEQDDAAEALQQHARKCTLQAIVLEDSLNHLKKNQQQAMNTLYLLEVLRQELPQDEAGAKRNLLWINLVEATTLKRLKTCGEKAVQLLEYKIYNLQKEAAQAKRVISRLAAKKTSPA